MVLSVENVRKIYNGGETPVEAVRGVSLDMPAGDFVALMGPSGCGKSTLLHLCGAMDRPTSGRVLIDHIDISQLNDDRLTAFRRRQIGFVFQFFNLLPTLTVIENISLPLSLDGKNADAAEDSARNLAERVGLSHRLGHYPQQLSGGEMQRAAIARAAVHKPALLITDEPTGNLDSENGALVLRLLCELNQELGITILMATHSEETATRAKRIVRMRDGRVSKK
ncbi:MAG: ABC transporter ATP-binding protein [Acidobacteria bacterium]|nr:ABC transporter ATP-binding protein [Acidobacteriota bacterium]